MRVIFESPDMLRMENHFHYAAIYMVAESMQEARTRAASYAAAGGRKRDPKTRRYRSKYGAPIRIRRATGALIAWMAEKMLYRRFVNFWDFGPQ